ncbi:MAG: lacto-N-biose phosphorylase central domain-containing protein, partial [Clostridia bacterium]
ELRLHPYLFPTGLGGEPSFATGCHPERVAREYWVHVRRALLRVKIDRIGLGGYLHLVTPFPEFQEEIAQIANQFRTLRTLHEAGAPWSTGLRVGVLQSWGPLRTWNCSGHMHEHPELPLNHLYEAMAGMPLEMRVLSLEDIAASGVPEDIDVLLNAGRAGDAWSGGDIWQNTALKAAINAYITCGGALIGVAEPSAAQGDMRYFQMADALGVDREVGSTICVGKYAFRIASDHFILKGQTTAVVFHNAVDGVYALNERTVVLAGKDDEVVLAVNQFGRGRAVYLNGFTYTSENTRLLYRAFLWASRREALADIAMPEDPSCECAYFPAVKQLVTVNNAPHAVYTRVCTPDGICEVQLPPQGIVIKTL